MNVNTAAKRTAHEYKFELPVNYAFPVTYLNPMINKLKSRTAKFENKK